NSIEETIDGLDGSDPAASGHAKGFQGVADREGIGGLPGRESRAVLALPKFFQPCHRRFPGGDEFGIRADDSLSGGPIRDAIVWVTVSLGVDDRRETSVTDVDGERHLTTRF